MAGRQHALVLASRSFFSSISGSSCRVSIKIGIKPSIDKPPQWSSFLLPSLLSSLFLLFFRKLEGNHCAFHLQHEAACFCFCFPSSPDPLHPTSPPNYRHPFSGRKSGKAWGFLPIFLS
ncbi:hypothetical protein SLEP1_g18981 [Rubroshorea leprosula]|uniref:Uncharacterized protein n=1 Tax=Rubroshorea leprosula TaxID=152421 RepID=A0AAV5J2Q5_9ROSI|nr:hypothetical protein SLEP1_g18981 [Rubroshorea leprosula]